MLKLLKTRIHVFNSVWKIFLDSSRCLKEMMVENVESALRTSQFLIIYLHFLLSTFYAILWLIIR